MGLGRRIQAGDALSALEALRFAVADAESGVLGLARAAIAEVDAERRRPVRLSKSVELRGSLAVRSGAPVCKHCHDDDAKRPDCRACEASGLANLGDVRPDYDELMKQRDSFAEAKNALAVRVAELEAKVADPDALYRESNDLPEAGNLEWLECAHCGDAAVFADRLGLFTEGHDTRCVSCGFPGHVVADGETAQWSTDELDDGAQCADSKCVVCNGSKTAREQAT